MSKININMCATSDTIDCWEKINFDTAEKCVKKLQKRIALAYTNCNDKQVECLQKKLIHSFYAKAIAINIVTSNNGNRTAGIDGVLWNKPEEKFQAIKTLKHRGYKHKPLKRMFIKKSNGQLRPLGIPTIKDRAMQTLYKLALEPIAEITADSCSFGFRHNKSAKDAIAKCIELLSKHSEIEWILKADIKACFDNINHNGLWRTYQWTRKY
ncbi:MAG: reverse transcriptase N-terminal domain-containing protein [Ruminococcus callidus]